MMHAYSGPALVTLANCLLLFVCAAYVGRCRVRFRIQAPATSGHPQFEIAYRIHMNTIENTVAFQPVLWLFAAYLSIPWATVFGAVWLAGRVGYAWAYARDPKTRSGGFLVSMLAFAILSLGAAWGVVRGLLA
ncbi:MAPEG family protein [Accumulibacter sp.]|uniref:MAPEG family protein n=1 Tax=Accumulibacter sp. TaxID=2053492 RepID=UPI0034173F84